MDEPWQDKRAAAAHASFRYSARAHAGRDSELACCIVAAAALLAAAPATGTDALGEPRCGRAHPPQLQADGDAALERGAYPLAASYYRRAAERADDERVAEQATQIAFDNQQQREAARCGRPLARAQSDQRAGASLCRRRGAAAAPARRRRRALRRAARDGLPEPGRRLSGAASGDRRRGNAARRDRAVPAPVRASPEGRRRALRARPARRCARRTTRSRSNRRAAPRSSRRTGCRRGCCSRARRSRAGRTSRGSRSRSKSSRTTSPTWRRISSTRCCCRPPVTTRKRARC